ncbi:UNVERIFIED_CONTAM: hypothetical protein GTU68_061367 [Idotea baltica]|nr:hypothetical protein [Idotea baltica]
MLLRQKLKMSCGKRRRKSWRSGTNSMKNRLRRPGRPTGIDSGLLKRSSLLTPARWSLARSGSASPNSVTSIPRQPNLPEIFRACVLSFFR